MSQLVAPPPDPDIPEYAVERIVFHFDFGVKNSKDKKRLYFVKWEGYPLSDGTWEDDSSLGRESIEVYSRFNGDIKFDFDHEISDHLLEGEGEGPMTPHFAPVSVVYGRERYNYAKKEKEMMYLVKYEFIRWKLWESNDLETIQDLIKEYETRMTGKKRKRVRYEEDSETEYDDQSDLFKPSEKDEEEEPPEKFVKTGKKKRKAKRKKKKKKRVKTKKKKKKEEEDDDEDDDIDEEEDDEEEEEEEEEEEGKEKKKKKKKRKIRLSSIDVQKITLNNDVPGIIRFHGVRRKNGQGKREEFTDWTTDKLKRRDPKLCADVLEDGLLSILNSYNKEDELIEIEI